MKRRLVGLTVLILVIFAIYSCSSENSKDKSNTINNEKTKDSDEKINDNIALPKVELSSGEIEKLNTFFSNFSEIQMADFDEQSLTDAEIINFAVYHNHINNYTRFENLADNKIRIKKEYIDETAEKYFDRKIKSHQSIESITYSKDYYTIENSSGEAYYFSQIEELFDAGDNNYLATVNVYVANSGWTGNCHTKPETWDEEDAPEFLQKITTNIRKKENSYIITKYLRSEN